MKQIPLTQGKFAIIDDEDIDVISRYKWHHNIGYAMTWEYGANGEQRHMLMHRIVLGLNGQEIVDHVDGNSLNNQKSNLRLCTVAQNAMNKKRSSSNTSGFKGVSYDSSRNKYVAQIKVNGKSLNLGRYKTAIEAHEAYKSAAVKYFGEFARFE